MLRSLRHPGVLRVIAVNDAKFAIAIEIMAGGSLHSLLHGTSQVRCFSFLSPILTKSFSDTLWQSIDLPTHCLPLPYILSLAMEIADTLKVRDLAPFFIFFPLPSTTSFAFNAAV